jgi:hypothetical protein
MTTNQLDSKNNSSNLGFSKSESSSGIEPSSTQTQNAELKQTSTKTPTLDFILMPPPQKVSSFFEEHLPQQTPPSPSKIIYGLQPISEETNGKHSFQFVNNSLNL